MGDFIGFTFGGHHSFNDLGIVRVSSGDRYEEELQSEIKDRSAEVPGLNGEYYFGSDYAPKKIDIDIAFDSLTEEQFRNLRRVFGTKKIQELIFDERPYKKYMAKIESPVELSYVCFDEPKKHIDESGTAQGIRWIYQDSEVPVIDEETGEPTGETEVITERVKETIYPYVKDEGTERIYKGEGKISFICYFPFAKSVYKVLPEESEEWAISSGILSADEYEEFDAYDNETGTIKVYNAGDLDVGFRLYVPAAAARNGISLKYKPNGYNITASLIIKPITLKSGQNNVEDMGILIDTTNEIIMGVSQITIDSIITTSGNIYNEYIEAGYFFHLEPNIKGDNSILEIEGEAQGIEIFYDYLYF